MATLALPRAQLFGTVAKMPWSETVWRQVVIRCAFLLLMSVGAAGIVETATAQPNISRPAATSATVGYPAPRLFLPELGGPDFRLREWAAPEGRQLRSYLGRDRYVVVLSFFATWCVPCRSEIPQFAEASTAFTEAPVLWRLVDTGDPADSVRKFLGRLGVNMPVLHDRRGRIARRYCGSPAALPTVVVVDRDGIVRYVRHGYDEATMGEVVDAVSHLLGVPVPDRWATELDSAQVDSSAHRVTNPRSSPH